MLMQDSVKASIGWIEDHDEELNVLVMLPGEQLVGDKRHRYQHLQYWYGQHYDFLCDAANSGSQEADEWLEEYAKG